MTFTNATGTYVNFRYDSIGQLKVADSTVNTEDRGYQYDTAWNLNRLTNNGSPATFSVDGKNQLTTIGSGHYYYDGNGNLTNDSSLHVATNYYAYDDENQLIAVQPFGGGDDAVCL
ncbi:MAG: hypothetical protein WDM80_08625 [Limisphaerales bacterium]